MLNYYTLSGTQNELCGGHYANSVYSTSATIGIIIILANSFINIIFNTMNAFLFYVINLILLN